MAPSWVASFTLVFLAAAVNVAMTTDHRDGGVADDVSVSSTGSVTVNGEVRSHCMQTCSACMGACTHDRMTWKSSPLICMHGQPFMSSGWPRARQHGHLHGFPLNSWQFMFTTSSLIVSISTLRFEPHSCSCLCQHVATLLHVHVTDSALTCTVRRKYQHVTFLCCMRMHVSSCASHASVDFRTSA
jgi:hypothetical protein